jgi:hypothetical protein
VGALVDGIQFRPESSAASVFFRHLRPHILQPSDHGGDFGVA